MPARFLVPLLLAALLGGGCATILQGARQTIPVTSKPSSASVELDGVSAGETPLKIRLTRGTTHVLRVSLAGYEERLITLESTVGTGWVVVDLLFGLIPIAVDAVTSSWESFERSLDFHLVSIATETVPAVAAIPAIAAVRAAPAVEFDPNDPRAGVLRILDHAWVAFPLDGGKVRAKVRIRWRVREVELGFGEGLHVGDDPFGGFSKDRIVLQEGSAAYVQTPRGRVVQIRVTSLDADGVELEWADQSRGKMPAGVVQVAAQPAHVDSIAMRGGMMYLQDGEPVEFPVDGGTLFVKTHRKAVELRLGEGLHAAYEPAGPFSANHITLDVGADAYVLSRRSRIVHIRCTSLEAGEAVIEWMRK